MNIPLTSFGAFTRQACTAALAVVAGVAVSQAADISMNADDGFGTSSLNSALHWSDGLAPAAGNNYFNANYLLRTPADGNSYVFSGDSLTITSDGALGANLNDALMFKGTATATITVNNLTINGGALRHANNENQTFTLAGNGLTVGANGMSVHAQGPIVITAPVSGSGLILVKDNGSANAARTLHFASSANTFNGSINLETADRSRFALDEGANLVFAIGASGVNNSVYGAGVATFNGIFNFNLSGASSNIGDSWTIVNVGTLNETFGSTFSVAGFMASGSVWSNGTYFFDTTTGILMVPEPATGLLLLGGLLIVGLRHFRRA
jgi:hypothetical protein